MPNSSASARRQKTIDTLLPALNLNPYVGGTFLEASTTEFISVVDPATEKEGCKISAAGMAEVDMAVAAARDAFDRGPWPRLTPIERAGFITRLAQLIERDSESISLIETFDSGRTYSGVRGWALPHTIEVLRYYASQANELERSFHKNLTDSAKYIAREPVGVCALILPWNFPFPSIFWKLAPALMSGCTCIVKPSEKTPLSAQYLGKLLSEAGIPNGVVNIVNGFGATAGKALVSDPRVDKIAFTGSLATAQEIMSSAASNLPRLSFELGGKNANVVCADADLERAIEGTYSATFSCAGQNCCAASRTYVHQSIFDSFVDKLKTRTQQRRIGDPFDENVEQGPQIDAHQLQRTSRFVERAQHAGAKILCGGTRVESQGYYYSPTLLTNVAVDSEIAREEVFGPVGCIFPFRDLNEAIDRTNDSHFGLAAGIWTNNLDTAQQFVKRARVGTCWVNCFDTVDIMMPFGGMKRSGSGRELGEAALDGYLELKSVMQTP